MRFSASVLLAAAAAATSASAQAVVGKAYGFATGVTGGGSAAAVTPSSADELAKLLSDDTPRTILIDKEWDFTGKSATGEGCDRKSCSAASGGQLYLGDLSCGSSDNVAATVTYDVAGTEPLIVGSNKSILGVGGKGVLNGKGLRIKANAKNVIVQGVEITNLNPGVVWGGDALDLQGGNDGVWIDHCKFSLVGRQFIVSHYDGSRATISNNEFDGVTKTSASCNGNHYWTMMLNGKGDQITLDKNYFHDVSGRAPKLGDAGTFQATNNLFSNMKGHTFELYSGTYALIEGNAFEAVDSPYAGEAFANSFNVPDASAANSCKSTIGRACAVNSVDSSSGEFKALSKTNALSTFSKLKDYLVEPVAATGVASLVKGSAGPSNLGSGSSSAATPAPAADAEETKTEETTTEETTTKEEPAVVEEPAAEEPAAEEPAAEKPAASSGASAQQWGQCGGNGWTGPTACAAGTSCVVQNEWYSQCLSSAARRSMKSLRRR
ncbi:Pectin lyase [Colletotrichum higginsianum IMI 349063]|uniref:pectin lyase n=1 Tax=Colletotrichum higginsianum (strain IMI 349063) TaxID=759273 RepID=A0A1B7YG97_COLHI|nr:Pectin lyase [Colletotrichum higginsianum IMI 349063]OBR11089.1 Pectin lyase [Colletotrichum higginsianum IMI 349063]GJD01314.1 pectin lyase [Colletotrichum higginsianum]